MPVPIFTDMARIVWVLQPQHGGSPEWLKLLASALLGFIFALVAEPIKAAIQDERKKRRIENLIALEMHYNCSVIAIPRPFNREWQQRLDTKVFDHYYEDEKDLMFQLRHFHQINGFYGSMAEARKEEDDGAALIMAGNCIVEFQMIATMKDATRPFKQIAKRHGHSFKKEFHMVSARFTDGNPDLIDPDSFE